MKSLLQADAFAIIEKTWKNIMFQVKQDTLVLNLEKVKDIEFQLKDADSKLDRIKKNLSEYLESKRIYFPRFYFMSDEDLIEILGDSMRPARIQKHLKKCFEGINSLKFKQSQAGQEAANTEIMGIVSQEGEQV